jgi:FkbM family methyltransferase
VWDTNPSWFGAKRLVKDVAGFPPLNRLMVAVLRMFPATPTMARVPVAVSEVGGQVGPLRFVMVRPDRCCIAKELFWGRGQRIRKDERLSLEVFGDLAKAAQLVLDVGANTGIFSLVAALSNPTVRVHAFEIVPEVYEVLFQNIIRNDLGARVECHFAGVGTEGFTMRTPPTARASSLPTSVASTSRLAPGESGPEVAFRSLDTAFHAVEEDTQVLIKIDVEGTEGCVFDGGWQSVERFKPRIVCEILADVAGSDELGDRLQQLGYHLYNITSDGLKEMAVLRGERKYHDWLFCHESPQRLARLTAVPILG